MYHNEVLRCLLEVLRVAGQQGISLPRSLPEKARAMALADLAWMKPDRTQPLNGDSDRTDLRDVFTPAAWILKDNRLRYAGYDRLDFESVWDLGADAALEYESMRSETPECLFHALEQSGNWCLRSGWDRNADYLHFKCGSLGGGHGHFDKLHVDLSIAGEDVLIDSGRYTYVDGSLRRQLKSSCAHNVPVVDWQEYTVHRFLGRERKDRARGTGLEPKGAVYIFTGNPSGISACRGSGKPQNYIHRNQDSCDRR